MRNGSRDNTDLPICDRGVHKAPRPLQSIFQMLTIAQKPRPPITNGLALRGLSRNTVCCAFAVQHRERTASNPKREVPIADQLTGEPSNRGGMADEQDAFMRPSEAPLYLRNKDLQKARYAVVQGNYIFAFARRIPHRGPGIIDLGNVGLQGACGRRARVEPCPGYDGIVPLG